MTAHILYNAQLFIAYRSEPEGEDTRFVCHSLLVTGDPSEWEPFCKDLDAFKVRDRFLKITTTDEALSFLRDTGLFLPDAYDKLTWKSFQRWQALADAMSHADSRQFLLTREVPSTLPPELERYREIREMHTLVWVHRHEYFGPRTSDPLEDYVKAKRDKKTAESKADHAAFEALITKSAPFRRKSELQWKLERQFIEPRPETYEIVFTRDNPRRPVLCFSVRCTLEAIAAAIWVERIAGVTREKCPVCGKTFEIRNQNTKKTCSGKCQNTLKKRNQRRDHQIGDAKNHGSKAASRRREDA